MTIKEQVEILTYQHAISLLIDKKYQLIEHFEKDIIPYKEYEELLAEIENDINCLIQ